MNLQVKTRTKPIRWVKKIQKRDGSVATFSSDRITNAIYRAMQSTGEGSLEEAELIANKIVADLMPICKRYKNFIPTVEGIQDAVENELIYGDYVKTAKSYILFRQRRAEIRQHTLTVPEELKKLVSDSEAYFGGDKYRLLVYYRTYARWKPEEGRREVWIETVDRYIEFMKENLADKLSTREYNEIRQAILTQEVMPSMRLLQFAGKAARATNVCAYNCAYIAPRKLQDFGEVMYVLMCGTGVGFSIESKNIQALPQIAIQTGEILPMHVIADSKEGWCDALVLGMKTWFEGKDIAFDYSLLRPAGARLKTIGGKSSGPAPLRALLNFTREKIMRRAGKHLTNIDAHDILCKIGEVVVSGGVRRSAMISLSDLDDAEMRDAKKGAFYYSEPQRSIANNSAVYESRPNNVEFMDEWIALMKSGSGERGIFNRGNLINTLPERRLEEFRTKKLMTGNRITGVIGTNPCGEIILQSKQFCNLSEVIARADDTEEDLMRKIRIATILGTYQSTLTYFPYLSREWRNNCEKERLLGVSLTGQWDCKIARQPEILEKLKKRAIQVNETYAKRFKISQSTCITCVKPSGTVSQMVDCASGMHPRHSPYYIRRVRISTTDSLFKMLKEQGIPCFPEVGQTKESVTTYVLEFPVKAPKGAIFKNDLTALDQLEHWKIVKLNYTEHNPSVTISVSEDEWISVANWVYKNWDIVGGLSFLPRSNYVYQLAPYEEIDEVHYKDLFERLQGIDFSRLVLYESQDNTELKKELACVGGECEL
ncbi:MAG: ATP cone domain-containing protein [Pseudomonadota bacterium]